MHSVTLEPTKLTLLILIVQARGRTTKPPGTPAPYIYIYMHGYIEMPRNKYATLIKTSCGNGHCFVMLGDDTHMLVSELYTMQGVARRAHEARRRLIPDSTKVIAIVLVDISGA